MYYIWYIQEGIMKVKPNLSMRIDPEIKEAYKQETYLQGVDMTEPIENFMLKYAEAGQRARKK